MRRADPHRALVRVLLARYSGLEVVESRIEEWASATFSGARHVLHCALGPETAGIGEEEFVLPGHVVADIFAEHADGLLVIEALTVEAD